MNPAAVTKARSRFAKARGAFERLDRAEGFVNFESDWSDFLLASNAVYTVLEQGAKASPQSRQWFGRKKAERAADPLLQYLRQARNADEHGLEKIYEHRDDVLDVDIASGFMPERVTLKTESGRTVPLPPFPEDSTGFVLTISRFALVPVFDRRYGTRFDTPKEHMGRPFKTSDNPLAVARAGLHYHEALIDEAEKLVS